jgi:colanic acid biosynthesis glycosyl transferase WcaI
VHTLARAPRRVDVVIAVSPSLLSAAAAARAAARANAPLGIVVQDLYSAAITEVGALGGRGSPGVARLESSLLRRAAGVAVIHDRFRDNVVNTLGVDKALVSVIRNWVHIGTASSRDRVAARNALGWPKNELLVVHAGNMGAKQDLVNVIAAARIADQRKAPVRFVLIGTGSRRREVDSHAVGVERLAVLDPLPAGVFEVALAAADVLLVNERPGVRSLCVPSKLTSYFAAGRPVVAACEADGITAEELRTSGGGVWVPPGQPEALLDTVLAVAADHRYGARLGAAGRRYASTRLSASKAVVDYQRWVAGLVAGGR